MMQVLRTVDKANGYCFGDLEERNLQAMMSAAVGADFQFSTYPCIIVCDINIPIHFCSCVMFCISLCEYEQTFDLFNF